MRITGRSSALQAKRGICVIRVLAVLVLLIFCAGTAVSAEDGDAPRTPDETSAAITPGEASALTGIDESKLQVVWSTDYYAESYPLTLKIDLSGLDGLPVYVFERIGGEWTLVTVGTAPYVDIPVAQGGAFSAVTTTVGANYPAKDTTMRAPGTGESGWLLATAVVTAAGIAFALISTRKRVK